MGNLDEKPQRYDAFRGGMAAFDDEEEKKKGLVPGASQKAADAATRRMVAQGGKGPAAPQTNEPFPPGTELYVSRTGGYHHSGIYVGGNEVVHVFAEPMGAAKALLQGDPIVSVVKTSLSKYLDGASLSSATRGPSPQTFSNADVISRANARVGEPWSYNPFSHNCQHFSSQVVSGAAYSPEASKIQHAFQALPPEVQQGVSSAAQAVGERATHAAEGAKDKLGSVATSVGSKAVDAGKSLMEKFSFW